MGFGYPSEVMLCFTFLDEIMLFSIILFT